MARTRDIDPESPAVRAEEGRDTGPFGPAPPDDHPASLRERARLYFEKRNTILAGIALAALIGGGALVIAGSRSEGEQIWRAAVVLLTIDLAYEVVRTTLRSGEAGVDTIALVAMVGSLLLGEELAGLIVGVMFTGGGALESLASSRARRELSQLVANAPTSAGRMRSGVLETVPVGEIQIGDVLMVRSGELIPVDGALLSPAAVIDTSTLSGESLPVGVSRGEELLSGTSNAGAPFECRASRAAADSAYAALVRLVESAQADRAPFVRMADRYARFFLPATLVLAGLAWLLSGDALRALAVVVVATPCPLILAAPIALVSGLSRAAKAGVIVKGASSIEALGEARTVLFDKTGTLTAGSPEVREIVTDGMDRAQLLRLAASLDSLSLHPQARSLVRNAHETGLELEIPTAVEETAGQGIVGRVGAHDVAVGSIGFVRAAEVDCDDFVEATSMAERASGEARIFVGVDGRLAGIVVLADETRPEAREVVERLHALGVGHVAMVSGDRRSVAERVAGELGLDAFYADLTPADKMQIVRELRADPLRGKVVMAGDGVNDAPALALADVGIAMGAAGATVASEAADAVITVDRVDLVVDALQAGRRSLEIAKQSVIAGMGLSLIAMVLAALGHIPPVAGAILQEGIDLAVILNALRALRP